MKGTWSMWLRGALGVALMTGLASTAFAQGAGKAPWKQGKTADGQPRSPYHMVVASGGPGLMVIDGAGCVIVEPARVH